MCSWFLFWLWFFGIMLVICDVDVYMMFVSESVDEGVKCFGGVVVVFDYVFMVVGVYMYFEEVVLW